MTRKKTDTKPAETPTDLVPMTTTLEEVAYEKTFFGQTIKVVLDKQSKAARILAILLEKSE